jgi:hypothetical protein
MAGRDSRKPQPCHVAAADPSAGVVKVFLTAFGRHATGALTPGANRADMAAKGLTRRQMLDGMARIAAADAQRKGSPHLSPDEFTHA